MKREKEEEFIGNTEPVQEEKKSRKKKSNLMDILDVSQWVSYETVIRNLPFVLFIAGLGIVYIWNSHQVEKSVRESNTIEKQMKELKWEYTTTKSELEYSSKMSEVGKMVMTTGLEELRVPPKKIVEVNHGN
ncbi:hypothetical protein LBMAG27_03420 [Bacteroidota bacterium]|nr:hypothetical protein LBMAG27_03420 [Bacteroidota bacterium]